MTILSDEARHMIRQVLDAPVVPQVVKDAVRDRYNTASPEQAALRANFDTVRNGAATPAARIAALRAIIDVAKHS